MRRVLLALVAGLGLLLSGLGGLFGLGHGGVARADEAKNTAKSDDKAPGSDKGTAEDEKEQDNDKTAKGKANKKDPKAGKEPNLDKTAKGGKF